MTKTTIVWLRRDLRLEDNTALRNALAEEKNVQLLFIFDPAILDRLEKDDARVSFIFEQLRAIDEKVQEKGSSVLIRFGAPEDVFSELQQEIGLNSIYINHDYEPYAIKRDRQIAEWAAQHEIQFKSSKDQVIFEKNDVLKDDGKPYVVFTPYKRKWIQHFESLPKYNQNKECNWSNLRLLNTAEHKISSLKDIGFEPTKIALQEFDLSSALIENYEAKRNFPAQNGTSRIGVHLRFGTISIRKLVQKAYAANNHTFLSELIWREFFMQILWHFPHTINQSFKPKYDRIQWNNNSEDFERWKSGTTGYPLVDAGMRELNTSGYMHNRVRMLCASFLCKHLLIDWRWGEAYFASKLLDFELASNVGNWQWAAGSGVDAAPYFRIFNPESQIKKFDQRLAYISKWVPDFQELTYPQPMVEHKWARERCLKVYKESLES
ncbi:MAG: deoxyribodipyrimidine photo-lyase [Flavobacteriaceae bacterium]|nr:deoxyribodipyrimidine photo-lyase [Flavobacteriaceae bacterium]